MLRSMCRLLHAFWLFVVALGQALAGGPNSEPFPTPASKKGLQVQMVDDALSLGVKHAALNFNLAQLVEDRKSVV